MTNQELIREAAALVNLVEQPGFKSGHVGCALITPTGTVYCGVALEITSGLGFCSERAAAAAMITAQEFVIDRIVAVKKNSAGQVVVLAPCGACRKFLRKIDPANLAARVILDVNKMVTINELLPYQGWRGLQKEG